MSYKTVGLVGDSIAQGYWDEEGYGWFGRFANKLIKKYPYQFGFSNMSCDGDCSVDAYHRLCNECLNRKIDICLLSVGTSDIAKSQVNTDITYLSSVFYQEQWSRMLSISSKSFEKTIVIGLLPVEEDKFPLIGAEDKLWYLFNKDIKDYNLFLEGMCRKQNILFINIYDLFEKNDFKDLYKDGCHPNAKGHELYANYIFEQIEKELVE